MRQLKDVMQFKKKEIANLSMKVNLTHSTWSDLRPSSRCCRLAFFRMVQLAARSSKTHVVWMTVFLHKETFKEANVSIVYPEVKVTTP